MAGLLARPVSLTPSHPDFTRNSGGVCQKPFMDLQLRAQLPICAGFPLHYRTRTIVRQTNNRIQC